MSPASREFVALRIAALHSVCQNGENRDVVSLSERKDEHVNWYLVCDGLCSVFGMHGLLWSRY